MILIPPEVPQILKNQNKTETINYCTKLFHYLQQLVKYRFYKLQSQIGILISQELSFVTCHFFSMCG
jgi:hypothetical protein